MPPQTTCHNLWSVPLARVSWCSCSKSTSCAFIDAQKLFHLIRYLVFWSTLFARTRAWLIYAKIRNCAFRYFVDVHLVNPDCIFHPLAIWHLIGLAKFPIPPPCRFIIMFWIFFRCEIEWFRHNHLGHKVPFRARLAENVYCTQKGLASSWNPRLSSLQIDHESRFYTNSPHAHQHPKSANLQQ